jgi:hypothetical protein
MILIEYRLYPEDFWKVERVDWEKASLSEYDTLHFHGDLIFRCGCVNLDYRNIPLLGFAHEFTEAFLDCVQAGEAEVVYSLLEGNDRLQLHLAPDGQVRITASYTSAVCLVSIRELQVALKEANRLLVQQISERFPFLQNQPLFQQICLLLNSV